MRPPAARGDLAAVVLAAGAGTRLAPLTGLRPKALCPVGNVALLDRALDRLVGLGLAGPDRVAVNAHHLAEQISSHVAGRAHLSVERPTALGTAGAIGRLRRWLAGRDVLVTNADAYLAGPVGQLLDGWDGDTVRLLAAPVTPGEQADFGRWRYTGLALLPAQLAAGLPDRPAGLAQQVWRPARESGRLVLVPFDGTFFDCGTPYDYLRANLHAAGPANLVDRTAEVTGRLEQCVVGAGATVAGTARRCVVWPGAVVAVGEHLESAIRADGLTVAAAAPA